MTPKESHREQIKHYRELISDYEQNIIPRLETNLKNPKFSTTRREGFKRLLQVSKKELRDARKNLGALLTKGGIQTSLDDGKEIAKWQKQAHPNMKSLPYKEWKKKYGDKFTKPEYKEAK